MKIIVFFLLLALTTAAQAGNWHWLQLCKHRTGELVDELKHQGMKTLARAWIDMDQVDLVMPLKIEGCVRIEFKDGTGAVVHKSLTEIQCMLQRGPGCDER